MDEVAALDAVAHFVSTYRALDEQIKQLIEMRDGVRRELQAALGDAEIGTIGGERVVRCTRLVQHRLSMAAVRDKFTTADLADCYVDIPQTRFALI